ncbi:hypothetical protein [Brucella abortus]|uniref:hypothetical protein n=1 Tax=Brucella abortus TaxID=235 RepID=UPI003D2A41CD
MGSEARSRKWGHLSENMRKQTLLKRAGAEAPVKPDQNGISSSRSREKPPLLPEDGPDEPKSPPPPE